MNEMFQRYGCVGSFLLVIAVLVLVREWYIKHATVHFSEKGGQGIFALFPSSATDVSWYRSFSSVYYEYTIEIDDFYREARLSGWDLIPIPSEPEKGVEIHCFQYEKYKKGEKMSEDFFYKKKISHGYYYDNSRGGHCSLIVYCSDSQRLYYMGGR